MKRIGFVLAFILPGLFAGACTSTYYGVFYYQSGLPKSLRDDRFAIAISRESPPKTEYGSKDFLFTNLTIENVGSEEAVFDSGQLELKDLDTGVSYFSISKDKESVEVPAGRSDFISKITLKPGQKTEGTLWFVTPPGQAKAKRIELKMQNTSIVLER